LEIRPTDHRALAPASALQRKMGTGRTGMRCRKLRRRRSGGLIRREDWIIVVPAARPETFDAPFRPLPCQLLSARVPFRRKRTVGAVFPKHISLSKLHTFCSRVRPLPSSTLATRGDTRLRKTDAPSRSAGIAPQNSDAAPVAIPVSFPAAVCMVETNCLAGSYCPYFC
jgi:hypothetical protein